MTPDPRAKKLAAALAAVNAWLAEEAALAAAATPPPTPGPGFSPWALAGRLQLMGTRLAFASKSRSRN